MDVAAEILGAIGAVSAIGLIFYLANKLRAAEAWIDEIIAELEDKQS